ncbi:hypothetical protein BC826DRAFT_976494 [Russula brevipes]|nr:hypothetical protein BC826DRAFT_976494 [Russula brevipes]
MYLDFDRQKPKIQSAIHAYLLCNPTAFNVDELLILAQAELDKDPRGEIAEAIVAAGAMGTVQERSPFPLPIPPPREATISPWHPRTPSESSSPSPSSSSSISGASNEYVDLEGVPEGKAPDPDLTTGGWYPTIPTEQQLYIPTSTSKHWQQAPAAFVRTYIDPWKADPVIEGAEEELRQYLSSDNYFHGVVQRALWQLGDYGRALHEQEMMVTRIEGMARYEHHKLEQDKQGLQIERYNVERCLHEARVMECLHPYLKKDGARREMKIDPLQTRAEKNKHIEQ